MRTSSRGRRDRCGFTLLGWPLVRARAGVEYAEASTSTRWRRPSNAKACSSASLRSTGGFKVPLSRTLRRPHGSPAPGIAAGHTVEPPWPRRVGEQEDAGKGCAHDHRAETRTRVQHASARGVDGPGVRTDLGRARRWNRDGRRCRFIAAGRKPGSDGAATVAAPLPAAIRVPVKPPDMIRAPPIRRRSPPTALSTDHDRTRAGRRPQATMNKNRAARTAPTPRPRRSTGPWGPSAYLPDK